MTNKFAGTQTEKNLWTAFAGESQARNKYDYFAGVARKEGYQQIAEIFMETAMNERQHAKIWFKHLEGLGNTAENLKSAASGENYEWTDMYEGFAKTALRKKVLLILPLNSVLSELLKRLMKNASSSFSTMLK